MRFRKKSIPGQYAHIDLNKADSSYLSEITDYYADIGHRNCTPYIHLLIDERLSVRSKYFLPDELRTPVLNVINGTDREKYIDKSLYPLIVKTDRQP
ncbi:MAG: hypothetical protein R6U28_02820, partial [Cyclonatronaceae bacterium]